MEKARVLWKEARTLISNLSHRALIYASRRVPPPDFGQDELSIIRTVQPYTMTSPERLHALIHATRYISDANIAGAIVECGVWRGGSMMAVALSLLEGGKGDRDLYLFDTFEGMVEPDQRDVSVFGEEAGATFQGRSKKPDSSDWCDASLEDVERALATTGYESGRLHFVKGRVEHTIPREAPDAIALLRLDTDWYESTRHELVHLYPRLVSGGVLIIDDYGYWKGCREAVDEYFAQEGIGILLNRIDYTGRIAVKP